MVHRLGSKLSLNVGALLVGTGYLLSVPMPRVYGLLLTYGVLPGEPTSLLQCTSCVGCSCITYITYVI